MRELANENEKQGHKMALMLTGGFRSLGGMQEALQSGAVDMVGMARPFADAHRTVSTLLATSAAGGVTPSFDNAFPRPNLSFLIDAFEVPLQNFWHQYQMHRLASGQEADFNASKIKIFLSNCMGYIWNPRNSSARGWFIMLLLLAVSLLCFGTALRWFLY